MKPFHMLKPIVVSVGLCALFTGCGDKPADDVSKVQKQNMDRTNQIVKQSGGDWDKVSPDDRQFLIKGPGYGNEREAKTWLVNESAHLGAGPVQQGGPTPPINRPPNR